MTEASRLQPAEARRQCDPTDCPPAHWPPKPVSGYALRQESKWTRMEVLVNDLFANRVLWTALAANAFAQVLKAVIVLALERRWAPERVFGSGGMPSSHSALVTALATGVGFRHGLASDLFAITAVFGVIIMYDATGIRRAAGMHALLLNQLVRELKHIFEEGYEPEALKTLLGHTYPQVLAGAILGIGTALISFL